MGKAKVLVAGAGGFIGHHLVKFLKKKGYFVRGVDIKKPEFEKTQADEFLILDLRIKKSAQIAVEGTSQAYNLAANMGGIGFIESVHAQIMHDNVLIDTQLLDAAYKQKIKKFFYASSALVYPSEKKESKKAVGLKEEDAYPANPDSEYGWEKLFIERLCQAYYKDYGFETRVARFHNVYGPLGVYEGGREKSPGALCRKIAKAKKREEIEVWGDGKQVRSYCYVDDCVEGIYRLMQSDVREPLNIGSDKSISINELIDLISKIAGKSVRRRFDKSKPQGARGRNSDNKKVRKLLKWEPKTSLEEGFSQTYFWIKEQIEKSTKKQNAKTLS